VDGFSSRRELMRRGIDFSIKAMREALVIPSLNPHSFGQGTVSILLVGMQKRYKK